MVSSLLGPQYHDDQFWTFSEAAPEHQTNDFDVPMTPTFADDFEVEIPPKILSNFSVLIVRPFPRNRGRNYSILGTESRTRIPGRR